MEEEIAERKRQEQELLAEQEREIYGRYRGIQGRFRGDLAEI